MNIIESIVELMNAVHPHVEHMPLIEQLLFDAASEIIYCLYMCGIN